MSYNHIDAGRPLLPVMRQNLMCVCVCVPLCPVSQHSSHTTFLSIFSRLECDITCATLCVCVRALTMEPLRQLVLKWNAYNRRIDPIVMLYSAFAFNSIAFVSQSYKLIESRRDHYHRSSASALWAANATQQRHTLHTQCSPPYKLRPLNTLALSIYALLIPYSRHFAIKTSAARSTHHHHWYTDTLPTLLKVDINYSQHLHVMMSFFFSHFMFPLRLLNVYRTTDCWELNDIILIVHILLNSSDWTECQNLHTIKIDNCGTIVCSVVH